MPHEQAHREDRAPCRLAVITGDHAAADPTKPGAHYNPEDFVTHNAMVAAFESLPGYAVEVINDHSGLIDRMRDAPPDLVVNFCDTGYRNQPSRELNIPAYLELLEIPYTGASPAAMVICYDKQIVRLVAEAQGLPVPKEAFVAADTPNAELPRDFPALIKPNMADGSVGITKDSVVRSADEAAAYFGWLRRTLPGRDALFQEYLPGPEYGIGVIGNPEGVLTVLPALEVDFSALPAGLNPILSYESKTDPESPYWTDIRFKRAELPASLEAEMGRQAERLFARLGLRDYGRFDFRCAADGIPRLMEVNPNPAWANDGKLAFMAGFAGIDYPRMLEMIVEAARFRTGA